MLPAHHCRPQPTRKPVAGGHAPAGRRGAAVAHSAYPTRLIHQTPHTVWATGRAHGGVPSQRWWASLERPARTGRNATGQHHPRHP